MHIIFRS